MNTQQPGDVLDFRSNELTSRETEVMILVQKGMKNSKIANHLFVSEKTIKFHITNLYRKLSILTGSGYDKRARLIDMGGYLPAGDACAPIAV